MLLLHLPARPAPAILTLSKNEQEALYSDAEEKIRNKVDVSWARSGYHHPLTTCPDFWTAKLLCCCCFSTYFKWSFSLCQLDSLGLEQPGRANVTLVHDMKNGDTSTNTKFFSSLQKRNKQLICPNVNGGWHGLPLGLLRTLHRGSRLHKQ